MTTHIPAGRWINRGLLALLLLLCVGALLAGLAVSHHLTQRSLTHTPPLPIIAPIVTGQQALHGVTSKRQLQQQLADISDPIERARLARGAAYLFESAPDKHCVAVRLPFSNHDINGQQLVHILEQFEALQTHPQAPIGWCFNGYFADQTKPLAAQPELAFVDIERAQAKGQQIVVAADARVDLLAHELAHLAGLADEYAMRKPLAARYCAGRYRHPSLNVVVTEQQVLSAAELKALWQQLPWRNHVEDWRQLGQQTAAGWQLGSRAGVGLYPAKTCAETRYFAWKPVAETTAMQHFDIPVWPALYLELMRDYLQGRRDLRNDDNWASGGEEPH